MSEWMNESFLQLLTIEWKAAALICVFSKNI